MTNNDFDTRKLEVYLEHLDRGFILLTANAKNEKKRLIQMISKYSSIKKYDLNKINFHDTLFELKNLFDIDTIIYHNFNLPDDILHKTLEKINLSRDLLLERGKKYIFIVPVYVEKIIQRDYPNLFSYFSLKESFAEKYNIFFEYIFPNSDYLITKQIRHESKTHYNSGVVNNLSKDENLNERLDYFTHSRINEKELSKLIEDVNSYLKESLLTETHQDLLYRNIIELKIARVLLNQKRYTDAFAQYKKIFNKNKYKFSDITYDALLGLGDSCYLMNKYKDALYYYNCLDLTISEQKECIFEDHFNKYKICIFTRTAMCHMKNNNLKTAYDMMNEAITLIENNDKYLNNEYFEIFYNHILMYFAIDNSNEEILERDFKYLEKTAITVVQKAMQYTIFSWYYGIIEGNTYVGLDMSQRALKFKRSFFVENDLRIAESHYVNSILYMMIGDINSSIHCCEKCENILKNFTEYERQKKTISDLRKKIEVCMSSVG